MAFNVNVRKILFFPYLVFILFLFSFFTYAQSNKVYGDSKYGISDYSGGAATIVDVDNDGFDLSADCNDNDPNINPDMNEVCANNIDDNCNNQIDEGCNAAPVLNSIGNKQISEGQSLTFTISATDSDNNDLTYSASNLPTGAEFNLNTRVFTWTPSFGSSGNYPNVLFIVDDGLLQDTEEITITVGDVNRPPVLKFIGDKNILEGETLTFAILASDPDNDGLTFSVSNAPQGSIFNQATKTFRWTPLNTEAGIYQDVIFSVDDGSLQDTEEITITVGDVNRPPVLSQIGNKQINDGQTLEFIISATDPDGNDLSYSISNKPIGAIFDATARKFSWRTNTGDIGNHPNIIFNVSDGSDFDSESITITVGDVNRPPVLTSIGNQEVEEGNSISFSISASDPDGDSLTYSASDLPAGAEFDVETRKFNWITKIGDAGKYAAAFSVTDNGNPPEKYGIIVTITVNEKTTNCRDNTQLNACSSSKPLFCSNDGNLIEQCNKCGCVSGLQCSSDGRCKIGVLPPSKYQHSTSKWQSVKKQEIVSMKLKNEMIALDEILFGLNEDASNVEVTVEAVPIEELPFKSLDNVYQYVNIIQTGLRNNELNDVVINFKIENNWLRLNGFTEDDVFLYAYQGGWKKLDTTKSSSDSEFTYYTSTVNAFGYNAIKGEKTKTTVTLFKETCFDNTQNQDETGIDCGGSCDNCTQEQIISAERNKESGILFLKLTASSIIIVVALSVLIFFIHKTHRNRIESKIGSPPQIKNYIKLCLSRGFSAGQIRESMVKSGYSKDEVGRYIYEIIRR